MSENFQIIKRKKFIAALVLSVVLGVCAGVIVTGALVVAFKLAKIDFHWALYIPIAAGVAALTFLALFLIMRPNDSKTAKELDRKLNLQQKVQTMVEYSEDDGVMAQLQRRQADEALGEAAKRKVDLSLLAKLAAVPALAVALMLAGIFLPAKKQSANIRPSDGPVESEVPVTERQLFDLGALIDEVNSADCPFDANLKAGAAATLTELKSVLAEATTKEEVSQRVAAAALLIDAMVLEECSFLKIGAKFAEVESLKKLAKAMSDAVNSYVLKGTLPDMKAVGQAAELAEEPLYKKLSDWSKEVARDYASMPSKQAVSSALASYSAAITNTLAIYLPTAGEGAESEELYTATCALAANLSEASGAAGNYSDDGAGLTAYAQAGAEDFAAYAQECAIALIPRYGDLMTNSYLHRRLSRIFGVNLPELNSTIAVEGLDDEGGGDVSGGWGTGDVHFGSNDLVYYPDLDAQLPYDSLIPGTDQRVFEVYMNKIIEKMADGATPDELEKYIRLYFGTITTNQENKNNGENNG